jgi:transglutaminase-like putative cysteine protease
LRSIVLTLLAVVATPLFARGVDIRPAPPWVEKLDVDTTVAIERRNVRWGLYDLLNDHQVRITDDHQSQFFRTVRKVLSPSGVENASELELDFDPSFETLTVHEVVVVRNGVRIPSFNPATIRVIEKEDGSDQRIYDGERTALIFVKDVRAGDVIDYSWSIDGENPILGGLYTAELDLSSGVPSAHIRHRLHWPLARPLHWRGSDPKIDLLASEQRFTWERRNVAPLSVDDGIPTWYEPWESVEVTEFASWSEVAAWADAMFQLDARSAIEVQQLAAKIAEEHATRDARITAAIRFVQDDIRYLGIEMGRNSHEPHQPWETLDTRWGDCKDKALLLAALLRELGVEAYPALVSTRLEHRIADKLPSPFVFDHVIVQVLDGGKTYWIDGTINDQGGTLATIETPNDGRALVVRAETNALAAIETNTRGATRVEQTYTTTDYAKPTELVVKTVFTGADADSMRSALGSLAIEDYAADRINELAADQPKIEPVGLPQVADDRLRNAVTVTERYRIRELWKDGSWTWYPRELESHLARPDTMIRSMPLAFGFPLEVEQLVTFHFPEELEIEESTAVTETPALRYEYVVDSSGKSVWIRQTLRARRDHVEAKDVAEHLTKINAIWSEIGYRLAPDGAQRRPARRPASEFYKWVGGFIALAVFVAMCVLIATNNRRRAPAIAIPLFSPGEAPASALPIRELDLHLSRIGCRCGASLLSAPEFQRARYDDSEMTIVTRQCGVCGREQNVYFTAA